MFARVLLKIFILVKRTVYFTSGDCYENNSPLRGFLCHCEEQGVTGIYPEKRLNRRSDSVKVLSDELLAVKN